MYLVSNAWCTLSVPTCITFVAPPYSVVWEMWYITLARKLRSATVSEMDPQSSTSIVVYSPSELNFVSTQSRRLLQHILIRGLLYTRCLWTPCTRHSTSFPVVPNCCHRTFHGDEKHNLDLFIYLFQSNQPYMWLQIHKKI